MLRSALFLFSVLACLGTAANAHSIQCLGAVCVDNTVHFTSLGVDRIGKVLQISQNGGVKVEYWAPHGIVMRRTEDVLDISYLSSTVQCINSICHGTPVHFVWQYLDMKGVVKHLFHNGKAAVEFQHKGKKHTAWTDTKHLSANLHGSHGYTVGGCVAIKIGNDLQMATIVSMYTNGRCELEYRANGRLITRFQDLRSLLPSPSCVR